ncbi:MAG: hypothetical protein ACRYFA_10905 [Janthinobacterium lividum]
MKDELIDAMNAKFEQNRWFVTISAFCLMFVKFLLNLLIIPVKRLKLVNPTDSTLVKKFFWNFG